MYKDNRKVCETHNYIYFLQFNFSRYLNQFISLQLPYL